MSWYRHRRCCRWLVGLLFWSFMSVAGAAEFQVTALSTELIDDQYLMDAQIDYRLSDRAHEALLNGVPLTLEVHLQLRRDGAWVWESDLLDLRLRYRIRYLALSSIYQVEDLQSKTQQNFITQRAALAALGKIDGYPLVRKQDLESGERYLLSLRSSLDIESLPLPLRPLAYLTPDWNLSSEWSQWLLQP